MAHQSEHMQQGFCACLCDECWRGGLCACPGCLCQKTAVRQDVEPAAPPLFPPKVRSLPKE